MLLMLFVVGCYTICSLSDKYAVSVGKLKGSELTFLMAASTTVFLLPCLPFLDTTMTLGWQSILGILLLAASKLLEFFMGAMILVEMSAFELKAWLGILLFVSYFVDVANGDAFLWSCLLCIGITTAGLVLIAQSEKRVPVHYGRIALPMVVYLAAKFGYGYVVQEAKAYISSTMILLFALALVTVILLPFAKPWKLFREKKHCTWIVTLTKIPNVAGLLAENAVIAISLSNYSFIQPMILVVLFFLGIIQKEACSHRNLVGSMLGIVGIVGFQVCQLLALF